MSANPMIRDGSGLETAVESTLATLNGVILGKPEACRLALATVLAGGHLLVEDVPGVGKTTLAKAIALTLGLEFQRIQFTSDMLPADIIGVSIYRRDTETFEFHRGPIFTELLLADEVNRATPKAQSALLEAMQESQVTVDGKALALPRPFVVIATQNPNEQTGTFPLPESQLDRFLMCIELGYPDPAHERELLAGHDTAQRLGEIEPALSPQTLTALRAKVDAVRLSEPILDYLQALVHFTRESPNFQYGLSPRGALALRQSARALALIEGRHAVYPDDVQRVLPAIVRHRLVPGNAAGQSGNFDPGRHVLDAVAIP
ncbi:MAG: MoxR family ATPase [Pseudomonadota bacterium]